MFNHLLSLLIWLPIVGAVPVLLAGSSRPNAARWISLLMAILTFAVSLFLIPQYQPDVAGMQLVESHLWIEWPNVRYGLGVAGFAAGLFWLPPFGGILVMGGAGKVIQDKPHQYMAAMLVLEG